MDMSRVVDSDQSVRPSRDTGFRMTPQPEFHYTPVLPRKSLPFLNEVHNDDLVDIGPGTLRSQILNAVRLYEINYTQAEKRAIGEIRRNVIRRQGDTPCLCMLPGSVPCTDCGAGL